MIRKIAKIAIHAAVIFFALILVILLAITKIYSPEKVRDIIAENLSAATNRKVAIESADFNVFKGLILSDIKIYEKSGEPSSEPDSSLFFRIGNLEFRYFLPALLKMELQINKIVFDHPVFHLVQDSSGAWNFDDIIAPDTTAIDTTESETDSTTNLPFTLDIKEISFKNLVVNVDIATKDSQITVRSGGVSFSLTETFLPKFSSRKFEKKIRMNFSFQSNEQPWNILILDKRTGTASEFQAKLFADVKTEMHGLETFSAHGKFALTETKVRFRERANDDFRWQIFQLPEMFSLTLALNGNAKTGDFLVPKIDCEIGGQQIFSITGKANSIFYTPYFDLQVKESSADINELFSAFLPILPDSISRELKDLEFDGRISLLGTKISGNPLSANPDSSLQWRAVLNVDNFSLVQKEPFNQIENLNLSLLASGSVLSEQLENTRADLKLNIDKIASQSDTVIFSAENISADFYSHLDENFMPDTVNGKLDIGDVFGSPLSFAVDVKSDNHFNEFFASLSLKSDSLSLAELTQAAVKGSAKFSLEMTAASLDSILGDLNLTTGELEIVSEPENLFFDPMQAKGKILLSADTTFKNIRIEPSLFTVGDFAEMFFSGNLILSEDQKLNFDVDSLIVSHARLWEILPDYLTADLEGLNLRGETRLTAYSEMDLAAEDDSSMEIIGDVFINAGVDYPEQFFSVGKINSHLKFRTNGIASKATGTVNIDSLVLIGVQDEPIDGIILKTAVHMPEPEKLLVDSAILEIPQWKMKLTAAGNIDSLSGNLIGKFRTTFALNAPDSAAQLLNNELALTGNAFFSSEINYFGDELAVRGDFRTERLDVDYANILKIDSLSGKIHFAEQIDLISGTIKSKQTKRQQFSSAQKLFYDVFRPYYQPEREDYSVLSIKSIELTDYLMENFRSDIFIENEKIEIPAFRAELYGGNISGQISVNLADGEPENIEWLVKANIARLNSARLLPKGRLDEKSAELDLTLELKGKGTDPAENLELSGFFYVTKIGVKFADNMLQALDPQQTDKSIQDTRKLLNWGYKPKLISVEIKHNNLYPTIHLVKGSFFAKLIPLNLSGGKIELARIPLEILFSSLEAASQ